MDENRDKHAFASKAVPEFPFGVPTFNFKVPRYIHYFLLGVKRAKQGYIPRPLGLLSRSVQLVLHLCLCIYKIIRIIAQSPAHNKRSLDVLYVV